MAEVGYFQSSEFSRQGQCRERGKGDSGYLAGGGGMHWEQKETKAGVCIGRKSLYS